MTPLITMLEKAQAFDDALMKMLYATTRSDKVRLALSFTRWKDGIDIQVPTVEFTTLAHKIGEAAILAYEEEKRRALPQSALSTRLVEEASWRCFHCGEVFTTEDDARAHFGGSETDEPGCTLNLLEGGLLKLYRDAEDELRRYRQEDHEASRTFYALGSDHARALMREEEKGYERGLRDGREAAAALGGIPEGWVAIDRCNYEAVMHHLQADGALDRRMLCELLAAPPLTPGEQK